MAIILTLREARGNTILWAYRDRRYLYMRFLGQWYRYLFIYVLAQEYIQLQLYKSDKARISQSLARNCNWQVVPRISVSQMLHVHVYDRTA